ncbi:MAG: MraY family glycosyltransferase [Bacillota bacterium]|nr:MraY family glycosyltransferase [Bacillota bacterium]
MLNREIINIVLSFMVAFVIAFAATPPVKKLAAKIGAIDIPKDSRRMHKKPIPLIGGLAIFYGFIASVIFFVGIDRELAGVLAGAVIMVVLGIFDDVYALPAKFKLVVQVIAASIPALCGVRIERIVIPFMPGGGIEFGWLAFPITVLWIVALTNAVNLIDGLDGLAVGVSSIASLSIFCVALIQGDFTIALLTAALVGACFGFLPYNFNPASIFMGDTGSTFLGFVMASISVMGLFKIHAIISFAVPFIAFGLPIFDTGFAIFRRIRSGRPIMSPDRGHLHHRLVDAGFTHKQAVLIIYAICFVLGAIAVIVFKSKQLATAIAVVAVMGAVVFRYTGKKHHEENK